MQEKNKQSVFSVEATQLEIDPRILEEERIEEELLRKELEEEVLKKLMEEEEAKSKLKSDTTVALNEMLSKKHYQSTVSIRFIKKIRLKRTFKILPFLNIQLNGTLFYVYLF